MSLEDAIAANTAAIRDLIAALANRPAEPAAVAEKPKRARVGQIAPEPTPDPAPAAVEPAPALTYDAIRVPFLTQLVAKQGREAGAALLKQFGVADGGKLSDIPEAQWPAVLEAINARCAS